LTIGAIMAYFITVGRGLEHLAKSELEKVCLLVPLT